MSVLLSVSTAVLPARYNLRFSTVLLAAKDVRSIAINAWQTFCPVSHAYGSSYCGAVQHGKHLINVKIILVHGARERAGKQGKYADRSDRSICFNLAHTSQIVLRPTQIYCASLTHCGCVHRTIARIKPGPLFFPYLGAPSLAQVHGPE